MEIEVDYYVEVDKDSKTLSWLLYPNAPYDMHFKKADEYGFEGFHTMSKQSFDEFLSNPNHKLAENIRLYVIKEILK